MTVSRQLIRIEHPVLGHGPYRTGWSRTSLASKISSQLHKTAQHLPTEREDLGDTAYALIRHGEAFAAMADRLGYKAADHQWWLWRLKERKADDPKWGGPLPRPLTFEQSCIDVDAYRTRCAFDSLQQLGDWFSAEQLALIESGGYELIQVMLAPGAVVGAGERQVMYRQCDEIGREQIPWSSCQQPGIVLSAA